MLKRGNLFLVANAVGDVAPAGARDLGLFLGDTRHLSAWRLTVKGGPPLVLSSQVSPDYVAQIDMTVTSLHAGDLLGKEPVNFVHLRRDMLIDDVLVDRLAVTNFLGRPVDFWLELAWAADFADVFEVRVRATRGNTNTSVTASLDFVRVTVDYTPPTPPTAPRSRVRLWHRVTVASPPLPLRESKIESGRPTRFPRPRTATSAPLVGMSERIKSSRIPAGVQGKSVPPPSVINPTL